MIGLAIAMVLLFAVTSTAATRTAGREMVKRWGRWVAVATAVLWILILMPRR
jgi:cytochrome c biogenesis protein CcdA